jgi:hypothetical protein
MNLNITYKSVVTVIALVMAVLLFAQFRGCSEAKGLKKELMSKTVEITKAKINAANALTSAEKHKQRADSIGKLISIKSTKHAIFKAKTKSLEAKLDLTDTNTVNYKNSVDSTMAECDTVQEYYKLQIKELQGENADKDTAIKEVFQALAISEGVTETLKEENKKLKRSNRLLKVERVLYPAIIVAGTIWLLIQRG